MTKKNRSRTATPVRSSNSCSTERRGASYAWGWHSACIARELQAASDALRAGQCTYLLVTVPPRHGKSELCSRLFPAWHLLREPTHEVMLATYGESLSHTLSRAARRNFVAAGTPLGQTLAKDCRSAGEWTIGNGTGGMIATGIGGSLTGRGAHVLIIDDYVKNRAEAESKRRREHTWEAFGADLMTRLAPAHAVLILATRWHEDDLTGRILKETDEFFPRFKHLNFPAKGFYPPPGIYTPDEKTKVIDFPEIESAPRSERWLFPERFNDAHYQRSRATLGPYNWAALFMGEPQPREGRQFKLEHIQFVDELPYGVRLSRGWDLASTAKQRNKDDPDFTAGVLAGELEGERLRRRRGARAVDGDAARRPHRRLRQTRRRNRAGAGRDRRRLHRRLSLSRRTPARRSHSARRDAARHQDAARRTL